MASVLHDLRSLAPLRPLRIAEAVRIAELQASKLLVYSGIDGPPVPDEVVRHFPRVQVETLPTLGVSGATLWHQGRWQMLLNASEPMVRQRFSVFHELKHVLDHPNAETFYPAFGSMTSKQRQEQIADYFAACALMPRVWINRAWRNDIQDVADLARLFYVSREAMRYRLNSLGLVFPTLRCEVAA